MPGKLTTHILDTNLGTPASGVLVELIKDGNTIATQTTNSDGRCDQPLLKDTSDFGGPIELRFHIGDYFREKNSSSPFLDIIPVHFLISAGESYHVPLICTPWSYSTYRGS